MTKPPYVFTQRTPAPQPPVTLTIAGSDPSGGAGIQADLKTFAALNTFGTSIITALTAQNTQGVSKAMPVPCDMIAAQAQDLACDITIHAIKIGMLANTQVIHTVHSTLDLFPHIPIILDPVIVATSGDTLLEHHAIDALSELIIPRATLITPNLSEASVLLGTPPPKNEQQQRETTLNLYKKFKKPILLKGGHSSSNSSLDFFFDSQQLLELAVTRIKTQNTHGTGCTLSAAITAALASGLSLKDAVIAAKDYIHQTIQASASWNIGKGHGPVCHNLFPSPLPALPKTHK
jgi:hydroxymethylpyrimidine/phosphomethylpyrimidine kinase